MQLQIVLICGYNYIDMNNYTILIIILILAAPTIVLVKYHHERKKNRKRHEEAVYSLILDNSLLAALGSLFLLILVLLSGRSVKSEDLIDIKTIFTIVVTFIMGLIVLIIRDAVINRLEDSIKLSQDYNAIISKYNAEQNWFTYKNSHIVQQLTQKEKDSLAKTDNEVKYPVIIDQWLDEKEIIVNDSKDMYALPPEIVPLKD